ncbi:MAG: 4-(cytidine 5'-diphospho)-2-C-methyl-D-erythritol kinase [Cycloclasticus sp. symbiont of Poecilosclerida sp. M]|nr:MAG: 4-(cytidine 5'-diphospho)-2-C-methyl-D-erythritol kinase [Cycloclasticus sp. symbiont of Poecilosclerida sp. M]
MELNERPDDWSDLWWPAPAKLNLLLKITGQRAGGYHQLQTVFQLLTICDWLNFTPNNDGSINLLDDNSGVPKQENLIVHAATLLKESSGIEAGVDIRLKKNLPIGAGLGGGSSDAATTLVVLNQLWGYDYSVEKLAALGLSLGADVPVFVHGNSAWAEGVGEQITPLGLNESWFLVVNTGCPISTKEVFGHKRLTRNSSAITIRDFLDGQVENDCLPVVREISKEFDEFFQLFSDFSQVYLTGTGSSMFAKCASREAAVKLSDELPSGWNKWVVKGIDKSPLQRALNQFVANTNRV